MKDKIGEQIKEWESIHKEQDDFYHKAAQWAGLSDAAYWVLYRIFNTKESVIQSGLCKDNFFPKQTINSAVARLNTLGYINLVVQTGNGNRKLLELTLEGNLFCEQYIKPMIQAERDSFIILTEEEREMLLYLMKKQLKGMKQGAKYLWQ